MIGVEKTTKRAQEVIKHRNEFQEKKFPNLGSIFATKNLYRDLRKKNLLFYLVYVKSRNFNLQLFFSTNR